MTTYRSTDDSVVDTITIKKSKNGWETVDGKDYWYEDGVKQEGTEGRGKEIYDPKAMPGTGWTAMPTAQRQFQGRLPGIDGGKWVRYDENGKMIVKGWNTNEKGTY